MRVLIAEDEPVSRRLLERTLRKWGCQTIVTCDGREAWDVLRREDGPHLAIIDWMMPGIDGPTLCRMLRTEGGRRDYVYVILVTARDCKKDMVAGLEAGADDYIAKPVDLAELQARLRAAKRIRDLQAKLLAAQEALHQQATHDPLTGLWNRGAIGEILRRELGRCRRDGRPLSVLMLDVDYFKKVNDSYGHHAGDLVLVEISRVLSNCVRQYDAVGRYGGEEFLVVLPGCKADSAADRAEQLRAAVAASRTAAGDKSLAVTVSVGLACAEEPEAAQAQILLSAADEALYAAKSAGRNCVSVAPRADELIVSGDGGR